MISRRTFVNGIAAGVAGSALTSSAKSYAQILGANDRLNFAINGLNGRGHAHLSALQANKQIARVAYICDPDDKIRARFATDAEKALGYSPKKSLQARMRAKENCSLPRKKNTARWSRWATSSVPRRTPSK